MTRRYIRYVLWFVGVGFAADRKRLGTTAASKLMAGFAEQKANSIPRTFDEGAGMEQK